VLISIAPAAGYSLGLARSRASSGCSRTSLLAVWQAKQTGDAAASVSGSWSAGTSLHSRTPVGAEQRRLAAGPVDSPNGWPHHAQLCPRTTSSGCCEQATLRRGFDLAEAFLPAAGALRPAGARCQRSSGTFPRAVAAACRASTTTPAGLWFSGQAITRWPRYFHQASATRRPATAPAPTAIATPPCELAHHPPIEECNTQANRPRCCF